ncbi:MAG: hypothetical protein GQ574_29205 [Crocinitomix sp.]|nr:hypothetical protein [Crocinitomix sp.]
MENQTENSLEFVKIALKSANIAVLETEQDDGVVVLQIKTEGGNKHSLFFQELDLQSNRSVKILKTDLGEPNSNLWIALVLLMKGLEPILYLIPSVQLAEPDDFVFIENNQNPRLAHFSNYEIKVFKNGMSKLNEFRFENMIKRPRLKC